MVLLTATGILVTLVLGWFFVSSIATVLSLLSVVAAGVAGIGLFYQLYRMRPLDLGDVTAVLSYGFVCIAVVVLVFRVLQHLLSAIGFGLALVVALVVVGSVVFSPQLVVAFLQGVVEIVAGLLQGDN